MKRLLTLYLSYFFLLFVIGCDDVGFRQSKSPTVTEAEQATIPDNLTPLPYHVDITPKSDRSEHVIQLHYATLAKRFAKQGLRLGSPIFMRIFKQERVLEIWVQEPDKNTFKLFKTYSIAAFSGTLGPKFAEGDYQAPEGFYFVPPRMMNPNSRFHLSFNLGYPNAYDLAHNRTGSALMVHGNRVSIGCYAMTDALIEEIYTIADSALSAGQPFFRVHSFPFRMSDGNLTKHNASPHFSFWQNLHEGYEIFEKTRIPPNVAVDNLSYVFN